MRMNRWSDMERDSAPPLGAKPQGDKECIARDAWVQKK